MDKISLEWTELGSRDTMLDEALNTRHLMGDATDSRRDISTRSLSPGINMNICVQRQSNFTQCKFT